MEPGLAILVAGALLAAGVGASLIARRLRIPALVLFLALGMVVGTDGTGWIDFADYGLARTAGIVALAVILFEGGLSAGLPEIRPVLWPSLSLAVIGTALTATIAGLAAGALFGFSTKEGLLVGGIVAATDGAAIFALLRGSTLRTKLARTLEGEAGLNDAVAVLIVIGCIDWITDPTFNGLDALELLVRQLGIGAAMGALVGAAAAWIVPRLRLPIEGLYPVATLAAGAIAFGAADALHGSGFVAVYLTGLALGSVELPARATVQSFHDGLAWVAQVGLFLTLGLLVFPSQLDDVALDGTLLALVLVFVARPAGTAAATITADYTWRERLVLGWAGLRGAVPVVLATFAVTEHVSHSIEFFNIVFFAVVLSTLLQGTTFEPLARRMGVVEAEP